MPAHPRGLVFVALAACTAHAPPSPEPEPARPAAAPEAPLIGGTGVAWQIPLTEDVVGLLDDKFYVWDRERPGIAEYSAIDGTYLRTREIAGLDINGAPRFWEAVPGRAVHTCPSARLYRGGGLAPARPVTGRRPAS